MLVLLALVVYPAVAQTGPEVPSTVENRMSIEFHAVSGNDTIQLNLVDYFGRKANFVAAKTQHIRVEISSDGIATLTPFDPDWRGIEEVVFAIAEEYLDDETEKQPKIFVPRIRDLTEVTSKDKIALISDAFTQEQYETIVGNLAKEPVVIASSLSEDALSVDINNEATIDFSMEEKSTLPSVALDFHTKQENITLAEYRQPGDTIFLALVILGIGTILILGFYVHYLVSGPLRSSLFAPKKKEAVKLSIDKSGAAAELKQIRRMLGKQTPSKAYKDTLLAMNSFLSKSFRLKGLSAEQAEKKLDHYGIEAGLKSDILSYLTDYREAAYRSSELTRQDAESLISFAESILRRL